jgi:hypothetical protein
MEQVLDVYKRPYNADNPLLCMDESPKQLIGEKKYQLQPSRDLQKKLITNMNVKVYVTYLWHGWKTDSAYNSKKDKA